MSIRIRSSALFFGAWMLALAQSALGDDPLDPYRERFKAGLEHYRAGEFGDAIRAWETIYRELGPSRGYRIAFDLGRAYESNRDMSHAADAYLGFIDQVNVRRESGDTIQPLVADEEKQAILRLRELDTRQGKIVVDRGAQPVEVKIDDRDPRPAGFVAYVEPGSHVITLDPGTPSATSRRVQIAAGSVFEMAPSSFTPIATSLRPTPAPLSPNEAFPLPRASRDVRFERRTDRPFSPWILAVSGGATLASIVVPAAAYVSATSFQSSNHLTANDPGNGQIQSNYDSRVNTFYATLAIPIVLGLATAGLSTFYVLGAKDREVPVVSASASPNGASLDLRARF